MQLGHTEIDAKCTNGLVPPPVDGPGGCAEGEEDVPSALSSLENKGSIEAPLTLEDQPIGPLNWNIRGSIELQQAVNAFDLPELKELRFSVTVADPSLEDSPLVACSAGFSDLTGYHLNEIVGRNCRFLLNGVPHTYINEETRFHCREMCNDIRSGKEYNSVKPVVCEPQYVLPPGELICTQVNATKSGRLFRNMFFLKAVWLDDTPFILGLQAGIPEDYEEGAELEALQTKFEAAWKALGQNMSAIELVLCGQFWYSAGMRRQE